MSQYLKKENFRDLMHGLIELINNNMDKIQATRYEFEIKPDGSPVTPSDILLSLIHI